MADRPLSHCEIYANGVLVIPEFIGENHVPNAKTLAGNGDFRGDNISGFTADLQTFTDNVYHNSLVNNWQNITFVLFDLDETTINDDITLFNTQNSSTPLYGFQDVEMGAVMLYNRRLSAAEVAQNYRIQSAIYKND